MAAWYGRDFDEVNRILNAPPSVDVLGRAGARVQAGAVADDRAARAVAFPAAREQPSSNA